MRLRSVSATSAERHRQLPGDALIGAPAGQLTHAITIQRPKHAIWPWLVQMGASPRAGWYSYDLLDNGGRVSARHIIRTLQHIVPGTLFPALPGRGDGFTVLQFEDDSHLVIGWLAPGGAPITTWAFVMEDAGPGATRLIARSRASRAYPFFGLPAIIGLPVVRAIHFIMQRKQLLGIAERVEQLDTLLDRFIPEFDVVERHRIRISASPEATMAAARTIDLNDSALIRAIVKVRAFAMHDTPDGVERPRGLIAETTSMGWRVLDENEQEVVVGAAAQPWLPDVTFRPVEAGRFAAFDEPGYVKFAWTLRIDSVWPDATVFATETRVAATDEEARRKFRHYWHRVLPGVVAIRWLLLRRLKKVAEAPGLESLAHGRTD
jgi:hypothetical protein